MTNAKRWGLILTAAVAGAGLLYLNLHQQPALESTTPPSNNAGSQHAILYPIPESGTQLPILPESDAPLLESLGKVIDPTHLDALLIPEHIINRFVVTIDNLPREKLPLKYLPTNAPPAKFMIKERSGDNFEINPENYQRYSLYIQVIETMDANKIASIYFHYYPLFQEAYDGLGYKSTYFNDRLITVIDHLLASPEITPPIKLVQPSVFYKFADPKLESLSSGQKLMIRMGHDNASRIKTKLREIRAAIISQGAAPKESDNAN